MGKKRKKKTFEPFIVNEDQDRLIGRRKRSRFSKGEKTIANFLKDNQISFYPEFFFKEMRVRGHLKLLFLDFYIPDYGLCIEFDGEQHYTRMFKGKPIPNGERNDFLKNAYCKKNGLTILRIKYSDFDKIEEIICAAFDRISPIK